MWFVFGVNVLCAPFAAARDAADSAECELLLPRDNAATYAAVYGDVPRLVWRVGAGDKPAMDHYEVWIDGKNVDEVPAGAYGHPPGEKVKRYEPYRPFVLLADANVFYYTPPIAALGGGGKDKPYMRQGHWRWCEMELHNTAWLAQALFERLPATEDRASARNEPKN